MRKITSEYPMSDDVMKFLLAGHTLEDRKSIFTQVNLAECENKKAYRIEYSCGEYYIDNGQIVKNKVNAVGFYINKKLAELERAKDNPNTNNY